jgi:hypothetical protein
MPLLGGTVTTLAMNQVHPYYVVHDAANLYWGLGADFVTQMPLAGGTQVPLQTANNTGLNGIALDATSVYWLEDYSVPQDCSVVTVTKGGGTRVVLASGGAWSIPTGIAVSGGNVYWGAAMPGAILSVPVGGGTTATVVSAANPVLIATDATNVYWTDQRNSVWKATLAGGTPIMLASSANPVHIAIDATNVYWSTFGTTPAINKVPIAGGTATTVAAASALVQGLTVDATSVYWTESTGAIRKAAK